MVSIDLIDNFIFPVIFIIHGLSMIKINKFILLGCHKHHRLFHIGNRIDLLEFEYVLVNSFEDGVLHED